MGIGYSLVSKLGVQSIEHHSLWLASLAFGFCPVLGCVHALSVSFDLYSSPCYPYLSSLVLCSISIVYLYIYVLYIIYLPVLYPRLSVPSILRVRFLDGGYILFMRLYNTYINQ